MAQDMPFRLRGDGLNLFRCSSDLLPRAPAVVRGEKKTSGEKNLSKPILPAAKRRKVSVDLVAAQKFNVNSDSLNPNDTNLKQKKSKVTKSIELHISTPLATTQTELQPSQVYSDDQSIEYEPSLPVLDTKSNLKANSSASAQSSEAPVAQTQETHVYLPPLRINSTDLSLLQQSWNIIPLEMDSVPTNPRQYELKPKLHFASSAPAQTQQLEPNISPSASFDEVYESIMKHKPIHLPDEFVAFVIQSPSRNSTTSPSPTSGPPGAGTGGSKID